GAIIGFARSVFTAASDIKDMASALGWSAEALQRFKFAAEQSGGSFEALQRAASKLNQDLAEGDTSTVAALQAAGLSFATIRAMSPEAAFAAVADAVGRIEDPMIRANVAQELFGKGALTLLPGMVEGYTKLGESATVMSNTTIERLEAAQDQWDRFKTTIIIYSGEMLGEILDTWTVRVPQIWTIVTTGLSNVVANFLAFATDVVSYVQATYQDVKTWLHDRFVLYVVTPIGVALDRIRTFFSAAGLYIVRTVQDLYSGVKMWLVDKFTAIVDGIKGKIDAVTGFFADMYDKVVGRSYVPEMVALIDQHFGRLGAVMVTPTGQATQGVVGHFQRLSTEIGMELGNLINHFAGPGGFGEKMTTFASDFARGFTSTVLNTLVPGLGTVVNAAWSIIEQGLVRIWNGLVAFWNKVKGIFNFFGSAPRDSPQDAVGDYNPNDPNNPFYGREDPGNPTPYVPLPEGGSSGDLYVPGEGLTPYEEYLRQREAVYGFARGTRGRFMNFGSAFRTTLHGTEAVVPQAAVPSLAEQLAAALATWQPIGSYGAALSPVMASGGVSAPGPMAMIAKVYLDGRQIAEASTRYQGEAAARYRMWR
ncbi:MAG: hypothetical protein OEW98_00295, partial [Betaproteobacteria bacterium]|nr:hypothetical protein [Betaproteobacteria bacterium]